MPKIDVEQRSEEWHAARRGKVTASIAAACLRLDPHTSPQKAYRTILGTEPDHWSADIERGIRGEEWAIQAYEADADCIVSPGGFWVHDEYDWLAASPDGLVATKDGREGLVEVKCPRVAPDGVPNHHRIQIQVQMACTGRTWCDYAVWVAPTLTIVGRSHFDPVFFGEIASALESFMEDYVFTETEPPRKQRNGI